jgi:teichuronic acid biosynthesis protein TuaF
MLTEAFHRMKNRIRKLALLLIAIPLLTAAISYYLELKTPVVYTAKSEIRLGNMENERLTSQSWVDSYIKSSDFLGKVFKDEEISIEEIKGKLEITQNNKDILQIHYTSNDKEKADHVLTKIVEAFMTESKSLYDRKKNLIEDKIAKTEKLESPEESVEKQEFLFDLEMTLINLRETQVLEPVTVSEGYKNPLKRGIFGLIMGLMVSAFLVIVPELFVNRD